MTGLSNSPHTAHVAPTLQEKAALGLQEDGLWLFRCILPPRVPVGGGSGPQGGVLMYCTRQVAAVSALTASCRSKAEWQWLDLMVGVRAGPGFCGLQCRHLQRLAGQRLPVRVACSCDGGA